MPTVFCLREIIERRGVSQSELARQSGVSFATINRLCTNATRQVSLDTLHRLASTLSSPALGGKRVEPGDLITREKRRRRK